MKLVLATLLILLTLSQVSFAQEKQNYGKGYVKIFFVDDTLGIHNEIPAGKNARVIKDLFYKSYLIYFDTQDGMQKLDLRFIQQMSNGKIRVRQNTTDSQNNEDKYFMVIDNLDIGQVIIHDEKVRKKGNLSYTIMMVFNDLEIE